MAKNYKKVKENSKSIIYEDADYKVAIKFGSSSGYSFKRLENAEYTDYGTELGEMIACCTLEAKNKRTGKKSVKRCYQPYEQAVKDFFYDAQNGKKQFGKLFKKID